MPYFIPALVVLAIGIGVGWSLSRNDGDTVGTEATGITSPAQQPTQGIQALNSKLDDLILQVENERQARKQLEKDLTHLRNLVLAKTNTANPQDEDTDVGESATKSSTTENQNENLAQANRIKTAEDRIEQALSAVGMDRSLIDRIQQRAEQQEMQQLYVQDQARREGWYGTRRYFEELRKVEQKKNIYRDELGDERYDRFLFESGQNNRVVATDVLNGSPAEKVGLKSDDIIYSYDGKRIFSWNDLTSATAEGDPQQMARLEVVRDNQIIEFYLKHGPIGIRLGSTKVNP